MKILILPKCRNSRLWVPKVALSLPSHGCNIATLDRVMDAFPVNWEHIGFLVWTQCELQSCAPRELGRHAQCVFPVWPSCFLFLPNFVPLVASHCVCCKLSHLTPSPETPLLWNMLVLSLHFWYSALFFLNIIQAVLFLSLKFLFIEFLK